MSQQNLNNDGTPTKVLWFGDLVQPSGFGRIGNAVTAYLATHGWQVIGASIPYVGWPPNPLPYPVWGMSGMDIWNRVTQLAADVQPDIIVCCQDFPYAQTLFHGCRIDWSKTKLIIVTPIDGSPVHPEWLRMVDLADATMVISRFGVETLRLAGKAVGLLHPGVDTNEFHPAESREEVAALRAQVGIAPDAFVVGSFMMNQGRKAVPEVVETFFEFARDKPRAMLFLDMDKTSPAGWDIPVVLQQMGVDAGRVKYREDAFKAGLMGMRERLLLCDITAQWAHREGFGLPNLESMACKVPPSVIDWCSGTEIAGVGRGLLVRRIPYMSRGTWGGARDAFPDIADGLQKWNRVYQNPDLLAGIAGRGYEWALKHTWDGASQQFERVLRAVAAQQRKERAKQNGHEHVTPESVRHPSPGLNDVHGPGFTDPEHYRAVLQQPVSGLPLPGVAGHDGRPDPDGDTGAGRLLAGLQPDAHADAAAGQGGPQ